MKLYICEKPSLAAAVAENLGKPIKKDGYFEVGGDCVAWLHGHIMELKMPEDYDKSWKAYRLETLPLIPDTWGKKIKNREIYNNIKNLLKKADFVVHVGDPDREGQLLVDEVLESCGNKLPTMRLFVNAMDRTTIQRALAAMEDNSSDIVTQEKITAKSPFSSRLQPTTFTAISSSVTRSRSSVLARPVSASFSSS